MHDNDEETENDMIWDNRYQSDDNGIDIDSNNN